MRGTVLVTLSIFILFSYRLYEVGVLITVSDKITESTFFSLLLPGMDLRTFLPVD